jgi:dienelactone hydrolase
VVSVLKGEGKAPILFGTTNITLGAKSEIGYLARPDLEGPWPTVVMVPGGRGNTSSMRDVARRLARHGVAVVIPDVYRGEVAPEGTTTEEANAALARVPLGQAIADIDHVVSFVRNPGAKWSSAREAFGVLVVGAGSRFGSALAMFEHVGAIGLVGAHPVPEFASAGVPVLALSGKDDEFVPQEAVRMLRDAGPHIEVVLYGGVGAEFLDDDLDGYDYTTAKDAIERLAEFFVEHLPGATV